MLQVPSLTSWIPESQFMTNLRKTEAYKFAARALFSLRTVARRTIWGDRLFLQFKGPATILMSSRGVRVTDSLSSEQVNEIADSPEGAMSKALELPSEPLAASKSSQSVEQNQSGSAFHVASVKQDGKVTFEDTKDLKEFVR